MITHFQTNSDAGAVRVGTAYFTTWISNGLGDGITDVYVLDKEDDLPEDAEYETAVEGEFNIYRDDCGASCPVVTLKGKYGAYSNEGEVYFQKWDEWEDWELE